MLDRMRSSRYLSSLVLRQCSLFDARYYQKSLMKVDRPNPAVVDLACRVCQELRKPTKHNPTESLSDITAYEYEVYVRTTFYKLTLQSSSREVLSFTSFVQ